MKHSLFTKGNLLCLILVISSSFAYAAEVDGITYADEYAVEDKTLKLAGTGLLRYWGFKAYTGALYLEAGVSVDAVLSEKPNGLNLNTFGLSRAKISVRQPIRVLPRM